MCSNMVTENVISVMKSSCCLTMSAKHRRSLTSISFDSPADWKSSRHPLDTFRKINELCPPSMMIFCCSTKKTSHLHPSQEWLRECDLWRRHLERSSGKSLIYRRNLNSAFLLFDAFDKKTFCPEQFSPFACRFIPTRTTSHHHHHRKEKSTSAANKNN